MKHPSLPIIFLALLLTACGGPSPTQLPVLPAIASITPAPTQAMMEIFPTEPATPLPTETPPASPTPTATGPVQEPSPTYIPFLPTPTETLLPPLELPTEQPRAPALMAWTGLPTYTGDSEPGLLFKVDYDPDTWAQTPGNFGDIVLAHRQIEYCTITPSGGRGLPVDWKATHDFRVIGRGSFDVSIVTYQDVIKFINYVGGDGGILTGFQVEFNQQMEKCQQDAETVLGTLRALAATPTPTSPTPTAAP